ncbi:MAG: hypothetical protein HQ582_02335 [Planctomycetes bacterium]|nr:hypothetical protein [Planctomycetota bacterium]
MHDPVVHDPVVHDPVVHDPVVQQIEEEQEPLSGEYLVDGSSATIEDIESVGQRGVTVLAPVKQAEKQKKEGEDPHAPKGREHELSCSTL